MPHSRKFRRALRAVGAASVVFVLLLAPLGCGPAGGGTQSGGAGESLPTADDLLAQMLAAYREAPAYRDRGRLVHSYRAAGERREIQADFEVGLKRPNQLSLRAYQVRLVCDGDRLYAGIADEDSNHLDGQVLTLPAPERLKIDDLLADPLLRDTLTSGLGSLPLQLSLLLDAEPPDAAAWRRASKQVLPEETIDGHRCLGLQIATAGGDLRLWIDRKSFLVRRMEYPTGALAEGLSRQFGPEAGVEEVRLAAEFSGAEFVAPKVEEFLFPVTEEARQVRRFVLPPLPLPSELFGKSPPPFHFTAADGGSVASDAFRGRPTALCWFEDHPACREIVTQLARAAAELPEDALAVFAVSSAPNTLGTPRIAAMLEQWEVQLPLLRDSGAAGADVFAIQELPTLVLLDAEGRVQFFQSGAPEGLARHLPELLTRLVNGDDLAGEILAEARRERELYEQNLAAAALGGRVTEMELPETKVEPRSEPRYLQLNSLWNCSEVEQPGNLLVVEGEESPRIFVIEAGRRIVELDSQGEVVARHEPELPETGRLGMLRTAVDSENRRWFAATAVQGRQAYLFNDAWKLQFAWPEESQPHDGLRDLQFADLAGDGRPELYLGYWNLLGVQRVALEGGRQWTTRLPVVVSLAVGDRGVGGGKLLVTSDRGGIVPLSAEGETGREIRVPRHGIHQLYAARFSAAAGPRETEYCGFSYTAAGNMNAVGLDPDFAEVWQFEMPPGLYSTPIEPVTSGPWLPEGGNGWVIVSPGGTIFLLSHDGAFSDGFHYGAALSGIGLARFGDRSVLLAASAEGVEALHLSSERP